MQMFLKSFKKLKRHVVPLIYTPYLSTPVTNVWWQVNFIQGN
jgi:hypothetical protein